MRDRRSLEDFRSKPAKRGCQGYILQHPVVTGTRGGSFLWVWNWGVHIQGERYVPDDAVDGIRHREIKAHGVLVPYYQLR